MANTSTQSDRGKWWGTGKPCMWQVHKSHRCRQTDFCELHPGELRRERGRLIWLKKKKNHREQEPVMLCIYKIAAVSNGNDVLCSQKLSDGLNRFSPSVCVTVTQSQETATCLIRKKATDVREQSRWYFTERNSCTFSSTGSYSCITFLLHQSPGACAQAVSARLT